MLQQYDFLKGTGVALITPFDRNRNIDYPALSKLIQHTILGGVDYLVTMGTTGEAATLSLDERMAVIRYTVQETAGRVPVVAGMGGNDTEALVREIKALDPSGVSAMLSSSPAYNKPSQEGIYQHYMELAEHAELPIIIYNVPGRTASNVLPETVLRLAHDSSKFAAVKEASGDLAQATKIIKDRPDHFLVLSGDDPLALGLVGIGGDGVISVMANIYPKPFSEMIRLALAGNFEAARKLNLQLFDLHKWLYVEGNPVGVKAGAHFLGLCENIFRLPLVPMSTGNYQKLTDSMKQIGI